MRTDVIDAGMSPPTALVQVAGASQALRQFPDQPFIAFPVGTNTIAILIVPFRPAHREISHLITAFAQIPGFGNQLDGAQHGILTDGIEEGSKLVHFV